jgi:hypothetical protein
MEMEPVTFLDSNKCTQTYDHGHSVSGVPPVVCGPGSKEKAVANDAAAAKAKLSGAEKAKLEVNANPAKNAKDAKANEAKATAAAPAKKGP